MKLFLCEKPSQAADIGKVLGVLSDRYDGYYGKGDTVVTWAFGHILKQSFPAAYGQEYADFGNIDALPLLPQKWLMEVSEAAAKQFKIIKGLLAKADEVIIATDADREGEVIGRELLDFCGYRKKVSRFWTSGLDAASVKKALATIKPGQKTESLYLAGLARQRADYLVGMNLSPAYTAAYADGFGKAHVLSIGRIQTPTLNLVVKRDAVIDNFVSYPHYGLNAVFRTQAGQQFQTIWQIPESMRNEDGFCVSREAVERLAADLTGANAKVASAVTERKKQTPPLPYSLSALQKEVGNRFGLSPAKVLKIAQDLYEKHKVTSYPRTPCQYLPKSQQNEVAKVFSAISQLDPDVASLLAKADPTRNSNVWNDAKVNKHSHHAIIPTMNANADLNALSKIERDVYLMIRNRYIALFYPDYEYDASTIMVEACNHLFKATGQIPRVPGWKALTGLAEEGEEAEAALPPVKENEPVKAVDAKVNNKKTAPPPRFTETSLLDEMRTLSDYLKTVDDPQIVKILKATEGLGTEATRGAIIERLFEVGYIEKIKGKKGQIRATDKGKNLIAKIPQEIADPVTTAKWELALAGIEEGRLSMEDFLVFQGKIITGMVAEAKAVAATRPKPTYSKGGGGTAKKPRAPKHKEGDLYPDCDTGLLRQKHIKDHPEKKYLGCSNFPDCKHFEWCQ